MWLVFIRTNNLKEKALISEIYCFTRHSRSYFDATVPHATEEEVA